MDDLRKALEASRAAPAQPAQPAPTTAPAPPAAPPDETTERLDEQEKKIDALTGRLDELSLGSEKFLLTGYVATGFTAPQRDNSSFNAEFTPVFLWKISDNLLAAGALELELEDNETKATVEYANLNWSVTDWLTLRGGVLLNPLSTFQEQLHAPWINKLPDKPLFAREEGGLIAESTLGFEARGGVRTGIGKVTYSAFVSNGPSLMTDGEAAGQLDLRDFTDVNDNKAVGGRIGYLPLPELEVFYGLMYNDVAPGASGLGNVGLFTHDIGVSYVADKASLGGKLDARVEFVFVDYKDRIDLGSGPFSNDRSGGYAQVAYRPTRAGGFLKDLECVVRLDFLDQPRASPTPADERRATVGLNYWINPRTVLKAAYEFDHVRDPSDTLRSNNAFLFQFAMGF
ncbi:MAG: hypothetical protein K2Q09_00840 [Phycisphaerales bacterium]|nr:hypothetical protein [Phycisphaerales bacterium]